MIYKKLACLAATAVIGATLMAVPAQARFGGGGFGGMHGGGFAAARVGGFGRGFAGRSAFVGRPAFVNRGFFPGRRFAFFPRRRFIAPFFGFGALYAAAYPSCWSWVPTVFGWRRVWICDYYGY
jgi:hypothetical protein